MYTHEGPSLYLTADKETVVEEGDPRARYLLVTTGGSLSDDEAKRYGLTARRKAQAEEPAAEAPDEGQKLKTGATENKARRSGGDSVK
jgi:hypothetical protein